MIKNLNTNGLMNARDALVAIMVAGGASDENISNRELISISRIVDHLPIFKSYDHSKIKVIAETVFDLFEEEDDAVRFAYQLEERGYPEMHVIEVEDDVIVKTCEVHNYRYSVITENDIVIPPMLRENVCARSNYNCSKNEVSRGATTTATTIMRGNRAIGPFWFFVA